MKLLYYFSLNDFYQLLILSLFNIYLLFDDVCQPGPPAGCAISSPRWAVCITRRSKGVL